MNLYTGIWFIRYSVLWKDSLNIAIFWCVHYYGQLRKHAAEANDEMWSGLEARFNASSSAQFNEF